MDDSLKKSLAEHIINKFDFSRDISDDEILMSIEDAVLNYGNENYISIDEKNELTSEIFNSVRRLGPLQKLIDDPLVNEIMVNGPDDIFWERDGKLSRAPISLESEEQLENIIQQIVAEVNRSVNEATPIVDARLLDGSRVNVVLPPIALNGAVVTIRKFPKEPMSIKRLLSYGTLDEETCEFLKIIMESGCNIIVSGGTSSGKTSFLNALSEYIPKKQRVIVMEDSAELQLTGIPNLVRLETRNANLEGMGEIGIADLIKSSLRMRPDRIIVGEVRDGAAVVNLLNAFNTGHYGESTIHSNSAEDTISRLETLLLTGADGMPLAAAERQIASAIDFIVYLGRLPDGRRKLLEISEIEGVKNDGIEMRKIYEYSDCEERLVKRNATKRCLPKLERAGFDLSGLFDLQKEQ